MDIKCKNVIFKPGKKHLFLEISSTNIDMLVRHFTSAMKPAA
jgi:hypothetical protein